MNPTAVEITGPCISQRGAPPAGADSSDAGVRELAAASALRPFVRRRQRDGIRALLARTVLVDAVCFASAWALTTTLLGPATNAGVSTAAAASVAAMLVLSGLLAMRVMRLYDIAAVHDSLTQTTAVLKVGALHLLLCLAGADLLQVGLHPGWLATASLLSVLLVSAMRTLDRRATDARRASGGLLRRVLLVGAGGEALAFYRTVLDHPESGLQVVAISGERMAALEFGSGVAWIGEDISEARAAIDIFDVDAVFVVPSAVDAAQLTRLRRVMAAAYVPVHIVHSIEGVAGSRLRRTRIGLGYLSHVEVEPACSVSKAVKRAVDIGFGVVIMLLALPVMVAVALAIVVLDGRPVFFRQTRIGQDLHPFPLFKFRTMVPDAESRLADIQARNERQGPLFKLADDPRVTRTGKLLRATSLDELPQLFNVLAGHMSLVGPRPAMPAEVARFGDELRSRHRMRPGVTGLWQVRSRDETSFDSYQSLDLFYVENWSLALDLSILACTGPAVVSRALAEMRRAKAEKPLSLTAVDCGVTPLPSESA